MTIDDITTLSASDESRTLELKKSTGELKDGMHTACAFLNIILAMDLDRYLDKMLSKFKNISINVLSLTKFNLDKYLNNCLSKYGIVLEPKIMPLK